MSDFILEKQRENNELLDTLYQNTHCSMCKDEVLFEELADNDGKCKFCWRKGRTAGFINMGVSRATAEHRLDNHQSRLDR